jgi:pyruvate dehydrogenase E2 component (dihydrolipoamide acetyltransferase)
MNILIPSLGDIEEVEVIELCVEPGSAVAEGDTLIVIESDKASMDVPAECDGVLESFAVQVGDRVAEGALIAVMATDASSPPIDATETTETAATVESVVSAAAATPESMSNADSGVSHNIEILVPDLGDIEEVEVIEVGVAVGDDIHFDSLLVVLESDKASMEVPAEQEGHVVSLAVAVGDKVASGSVIATVAVSGGAEEIPTSQETVEMPAAKAQQIAGAPEATALKEPEAPEATTANVTDLPEATRNTVYAGPAVRRLARELGVSLDQVKGSGQRGRITKDDLKNHVKNQITNPVTSGANTGIPEIPVIDFSRFGSVQEHAMTRMQQQVAVNMQRSWLKVPHVTQHDSADITDMEDFRHSLKAEASQRGIKLTPLAFIIRAVCYALTQMPKLNSSLHPDNQHLIIKEYINIGVATNTEEGLLVPVIRGANNQGLWELSENIAELAEKARNKKLALDDLGGGTFTVSSLGAIGGTGFTPIVNAPEVAILGVGRLATQPVWDGSAFLPRQMLPLSLSYDHRVVNGVDGGEFMRLLTQLLADVRRLAL